MTRPTAQSEHTALKALRDIAREFAQQVAVEKQSAVRAQSQAAWHADMARQAIDRIAIWQAREDEIREAIELIEFADKEKQERLSHINPIEET